MTDFKELLIAREEVWDNITETLFSLIPETLKGITAYLTSNDELAACSVVWESVALIDDTVEIVGAVNYPEGSIFTTPDGIEIEIDENNSEYFFRPLCLYMPLELVAEEDMESVVEFLVNLDATQKNMPQDVQQPDVSEAPTSSLTEKERIAILMKAKNPTGVIH